jgi:hypothetical protein
MEVSPLVKNSTSLLQKPVEPKGGDDVKSKQKNRFGGPSYMTPLGGVFAQSYSKSNGVEPIPKKVRFDDSASSPPSGPSGSKCVIKKSLAEAQSVGKKSLSALSWESAKKSSNFQRIGGEEGEDLKSVVYWGAGNVQNLLKRKNDSNIAYLKNEVIKFPTWKLLVGSTFEFFSNHGSSLVITIGLVFFLKNFQIQRGLPQGCS